MRPLELSPGPIGPTFLFLRLSIRCRSCIFSLLLFSFLHFQRIRFKLAAHEPTDIQNSYERKFIKKIVCMFFTLSLVFY